MKPPAQVTIRPRAPHVTGEPGAATTASAADAAATVRGPFSTARLGPLKWTPYTTYNYTPLPFYGQELLQPTATVEMRRPRRRQQGAAQDGQSEAAAEA